VKSAALVGNPLLARLDLNGMCEADWEHPALQQLLVALIDACDKRNFKPVVECAIRNRAKLAGTTENIAELAQQQQVDYYRTILYLAKYQCTSMFHAFLPATIKPCRGYHFWCAFGAPLPVFDRLYREAISSLHGKNGALLLHDVSDTALGFRCVFGQVI